MHRNRPFVKIFVDKNKRRVSIRPNNKLELYRLYVLTGLVWLELVFQVMVCKRIFSRYLNTFSLAADNWL